MQIQDHPRNTRPCCQFRRVEIVSNGGFTIGDQLFRLIDELREVRIVIRLLRAGREWDEQRNKTNEEGKYHGVNRDNKGPDISARALGMA